MCWISEKCDIKVAKKDITCYKIVERLNNNEYYSVCMGYIYEKNKINPEVELNPYRPIWIYFHINEGYHSYSSLDTTIADLCTGDTLVKCIIPKGSKYALSSNGEYASSNIILQESIPFYCIKENEKYSFYVDMHKAAEKYLKLINKYINHKLDCFTRGKFETYWHFKSRTTIGYTKYE